MATERLAVDGRSVTPETPAIVRAAQALREGALVAFPTETVYGLGARADRGEAVRRIFTAKGRPPTNPLIVHVADEAAAEALAGPFDAVARTLAAHFWPGPLTLIVPRPSRGIADEVTAGGDTIALRVPAHPVALALLRAAALPIAAPSANLSTALSPTRAEHVMKGLAGRIAVCLDGGPTGFGLESTIVDVTRSPCVLLRHGAVPAEAIAALVPLVDGAGRVVAPEQQARAPGGHARHYAPRARLTMAKEDQLAELVRDLAATGLAVGTLLRGGEPPAGASHALFLPADAVGFARELYAALHRLDDLGCDAIVVAAPPEEPAWAAVRDRLRRASA
jgi:L-threonylcarbamoyladenylate synthase